MNLLSDADGRDNIVGSLILAGNYAIPEVCVYFSHKLIRGNRTIKVTETPPPPPPPCEISDGSMTKRIWEPGDYNEMSSILADQ